MYLVLAPSEDATPEVLSHNSLFFKSLWGLELVSMKFESLVHAFQNQAVATERELNALAQEADTAAAENTKKTKTDKKPASPTPDYDPSCRFCVVAGPHHYFHLSHSVASTISASKEPLLSLLFVTLPSACPAPYGASATTAAPGTPTHAGPQQVVPGQVKSDSPLVWVNYREASMLNWLRACGRSAQVLDIVDIDWSTGIVTAWMNRTYVNYVRKCSSFAQVCVIDFEKLQVLAPPRSVVHLKTLRSVNIR
jgi:hypothetical protein